MKKQTRKIKLYAVNPYRPIKESPVIFDYGTGNLFVNPNAGYAGHYQIYDMIMDKNLPMPDYEAHGYWYPKGDNYRAEYGEAGNWPDFYFYTSYRVPNDVEIEQIRTALNALTQERPDPPVRR